MRRREFIAGLAGAAAWPLGARAQQAGKVPTVGYLGLTAATTPGEAAFPLRPPRSSGYVEGKNFHAEFRYAQRDEARVPGLVAELVALNVDVIVTYATGGVCSPARNDDNSNCHGSWRRSRVDGGHCQSRASRRQRHGIGRSSIQNSWRNGWSC